MRNGPAEVIIGHSGGCHLLGDQSKAQLILLVGMPHWPGKRLSRRLVKKVTRDNRDWWTLKKLIFNIYYFFRYLPHWIRTYKAYAAFILPETSDETAVIAVRNKHDYFADPIAVEELAQARGWKFQAFESHHDDLWVNPEPYVQLIDDQLNLVH